MIEDMRASVEAVPGPRRVSFLRLSGGPPTAKPISIKVRGDAYAEIRAAADALRTAHFVAHQVAASKKSPNAALP